MSEGGWIKLYRSLMDDPIFEDPRKLKVWIWCLLKASHSECDVKVGDRTVRLHSGEFIYGRDGASKKLGIPEATFVRIMVNLKSNRYLNLKVNRHYTVANVENWGKFQGSVKKSEPKSEPKNEPKSEHIQEDIKNISEEADGKSNDISTAEEKTSEEDYEREWLIHMKELEAMSDDV